MINVATAEIKSWHNLILLWFLAPPVQLGIHANQHQSYFEVFVLSLMLRAIIKTNLISQENFHLYIRINEMF